MNRERFYKNIATLGPIGYLKAPGTFASAATLPFAYTANYYFSSMVYQLPLTVFTIFFSYCAIKKALPFFNKKKDPSEIVIDEVAGVFLTLFLISWHLPITNLSLFLGFVLFRFFDITKIFFIKKVEQLPGAWGILFDDLAAAVWASAIARLIIFFSL